MADNTLNAIAAARRAMEHVVAPSVDPTHPLAREQAELVAGTLRMLEEQLPHLRERSAYELRCNLDLAREVKDLAAGQLRTQLDDMVASAEQLVSSLGPSNNQLQRATACLAALISALVRSSEDATPDARADLIRRVVSESEGVITGQRSWFAAQGWSGAGEVPAMAQLYDAP